MNAQPAKTTLKVRMGVRLNHNQSALKVRMGVRLNHNQSALTVK